MLSATLVFFLLTNGAYAQSLDQDTSRQETPTADYSPIFRHITTSDGLPHHTVLAIAQDAQGFLWFGTGDGLARYDGYDFVVYRSDPQRPDSISQNRINALVPDPNGLLWVGTGGSGLNAFDPRSERFVRYQHDPAVPTSLGNDLVTDIVPASDGTLWVGTIGGLDHFDPQSGVFTHYRHDDAVATSLSNDSLQDLAMDSRGTLWVATYGGGLDALPAGSQEFTHNRHDAGNPDSIGGDLINAVHVDGNNTVWAGVWNVGLSRLERDTGRFVNYVADPADSAKVSSSLVNGIFEDKAGSLWVAFQDSGANRLDPQTGNFVRYVANPTDSASLGNTNIVTAFTDRSGLIWFGSNGSGLSILDPYRKPFTFYHNIPDDPTSLSPGSVWGIAPDGTDKVWLGTIGSGLDLLDLTTGVATHWKNDPNDETSVASDVIYSLLLGQDGTLWVGTAAGLDRYDPDTNGFIHYDHDPNDPTSLSENSVYGIYEDHLGTIWVGTYDGLNRMDADREHFTVYYHNPQDPDSLRESGVGVIMEDSQGYLWLGTATAGIERFDRATETFTHFPPNPADPSAISDGLIDVIHEDQMGRLWAGSWTAGLNLFDSENGTFTHFREHDGLISDSIYGMVEEIDAAGKSYLWISSPRGLSRFDLQNRTFRNYNNADGLPDTGFAFKAYAKGADGRIFFGSPNGLVTFMPDQIKTDNSTPPLVLTQFNVESEPAAIGEGNILTQAVDLTELLTFPPGIQRFSIQFAALDYRQPQAIRYQFMLEGFDKDWIEVDSDTRFATYTNLDPGTYDFQVRSSNRDGLWSDTARTLALVVEPQWWQRWPVRGAGIVLLLASVLGVFLVRTRTLRARSAQLEREVMERTQELASVMHVGRELVSNLDSDAVLHQILEQMGNVLPHDASLVMMLEDGTLVMRAYQSSALQSQLTAGSVAVEQYDFVSTVLADGKAHEVTRISADATTQDFVQSYLGAQFSAGSLLYAPLVVKNSVLGLLFLARLLPDAFQSSDREELQQYANFVAIALENARLYNQAREQATQQERNRLAQDLHDSVTQTLFSASLIAEVLPTTWHENPAQAEQNFEMLRRFMRAALAEMRTLLVELRPSSIHLLPLGQLLTQLTEASTGRTNLASQLYIENVPVLPDEVQYVFYRIAQEAIQNVIKHAQAKTVWMGLSATPPISSTSNSASPNSVESFQQWQGTIIMTVADDGRGFDTNNPKSDSGGLGLQIMQERAESIGATLTIESTADKGTELTLIWHK